MGEGNGTQKAHECSIFSKEPYLSFKYNEKQELECGCSAFPQWGSVYISRDLCPGHFCETEDHPILDWDKKAEKCVCRSNPCLDLEGIAHTCNPSFPILRYREDKNDDGSAKPVCECVMKIDKPKPRKRREL